MSGWHRDNPELVGTDADPWAIHESYRRAFAEVEVASRARPTVSFEEWLLSGAKRCTDEDCREVQAPNDGDACRECGAPLEDREP